MEYDLNRIELNRNSIEFRRRRNDDANDDDDEDDGDDDDDDDDDDEDQEGECTEADGEAEPELETREEEGKVPGPPATPPPLHLLSKPPESKAKGVKGTPPWLSGKAKKRYEIVEKAMKANEGVPYSLKKHKEKERSAPAAPPKTFL